MPTANVKREIRYLSKDFSGFRDALVQHAKTYFPSTYNDFSDASLGMMLIEMSAYVGDVLSYYMDDQIKETMLSHATQRNNVVAMAQSLGYKPKPSIPAVVDLKIFQLVPARASDSEPDFNYALNIQEGMIVKSKTGPIEFSTNSQVDFAASSSGNPTQVSVYTTDDATNKPVQYLLQKNVFATSGKSKSFTVTVGNPQQFFKIRLPDNNIIRITDVLDSNGNSWTEVPYLAQDVVFEDVRNDAASDPRLNQYSAETPYLLKLQRVPKRFVSKVTSGNLVELQFGAGISAQADEELIPNPDNIGLQTKDGRSSLDAGFDPSNFMYTKAYGEAPSNVSITVTYITGDGIQSNVAANQLTKVQSVSYNENAVAMQDLSAASLTAAKNSIAVTNDDSAQGGRSFETTEEIRQNAMAAYGSQNRAVTREDYIGRLYSMPSKYGSIAKGYVVQDYQLNAYTSEEESNPLALNLYVLSYDKNKKLTGTGHATKINIQQYISQYRLMTDAINIKDGYVINLGINFEIITIPNYNSNEVLLKGINILKNKYATDRIQFNEPILISEIYSALSAVDGVQSVTNVGVVNKVGGDYSSHAYDIAGATINKIIYPSMDPSVFEIKYPDTDIVGRLATY
tara:strand:+ start:344 stop:2221 length:1878 start_codon:yes stop_codon:yes gene_type:complete